MCQLRILLSVSFISIVLSLGVTGQSTGSLNQTDELGRKQGPWVKYNGKGNVIYEGFFRDDQPIDTLKRYYENGFIRSLSIYSDSTGDVYAYIFHPNGFIASEGNYVSQLKDGPWKFFSSIINGYLINEEHYTENMRNGPSVKYFEDGTVSERTSYTFGLRDGEWLQYFENGQLFLRAHYKNGMLDGKFETWFQNGNPEFIGQYRENFKEGKWTIFDENGSLKYEADYIRGTTDNRQMILDASDSIDQMEELGKTVDDPEDGLPMFY